MRRFVGILIALVVFGLSFSAAPVAAQQAGMVTSWLVQPSCSNVITPDQGCFDTTTGTLCVGNGTSCVREGGYKIEDQGSCTMASGACAPQALTYPGYVSAPRCYGSWTGSGALTGQLSFPSTSTSVTPTSSGATDTAVVNWYCVGQ